MYFDKKLAGLHRQAIVRYQEDLCRLARTEQRTAKDRCQELVAQGITMIETTLSMLTLVCHFKKVMHHKWPYFRSLAG
jgi:hypothetical protein